jgi:hypothetical protein
MTKAKGTKKRVKTVAKVGQKPQAQSTGLPKRGIQCQKCPASDGSDGPESSEEGSHIQPRKKLRHVNAKILREKLSLLLMGMTTMMQILKMLRR